MTDKIDSLNLTPEERTELEFAQSLKGQGVLEPQSRERARLSLIAKLAAAPVPARQAKHPRARASPARRRARKAPGGPGRR